MACVKPKKRFVFYENGVMRFAGNLVRGRCKRCGAPTDYLPYCKKHAKDVFGVTVRRSRIRDGGNGLFATRTIQPRTHIAPVGGEVISESELTRRYGTNTAPYGVQVGNTIYDGARKRYLGHMANSAFGASGHSDPSKCNASIRAMSSNGSPVIYSTKRIRRGEEILVNYGDRYLLHDNGIHATL